MTMTAPGAYGTILAILVLYDRKLDEATSWPTLLALLESDGPFRLGHCLIHDNSRERHAPASTAASNVSVCWTPANLGTAGAYINAIDIAKVHGCDWLLLLDQDTDLPTDYLDRAARTLDTLPNAAILVPRVRHGHNLVSPATIRSSGSVKPTSGPSMRTGIPTAISSGIILRSMAVASVPPFPRAIWLDYVDHWMFLSFARRKLAIGLIDADLSHDLSIRTPKTLSAERLISILEAENAFNDTMTGGHRGWLWLRRIARAMRYAISGQFGHAQTIIRHTLVRATPS